MNERFAENLRRFRENAGYKQAKDFASVLGIKYSTYMPYEQGREPKYELLCKIADLLNVSTDDLLGRENALSKSEKALNFLLSLGIKKIPDDNGDGFSLEFKGDTIPFENMQYFFTVWLIMCKARVFDKAYATLFWDELSQAFLYAQVPKELRELIEKAVEQAIDPKLVPPPIITAEDIVNALLKKINNKRDS